ncbi:Bifunctional purine biosynthesis protein PurH [Coemansia sp. RSA 1797]|nr:Bifunctional purine biosynthesis protein PurH [Coemansia sp. RSA 1878]KAJ2591904.1 Bifunctional purine biosynthesis protein PurH [Coemansia sp. RSA 1797]
MRPNSRALEAQDTASSPLLVQDTVESPLLNRADIGPSSLNAGITWACLGSAAIVCLAPLQYGYHIAELNTPKKIITGCAPSVGSRLPQCLPMSDTMFSLATSLFAVGGLVGSLGAGWLAERFGRRGGLVYNNIVFVLGPLLMALAVSPAMLAVGRFVSGVGSGAAVVIAPLYLSEIAPVRLRGTLNLLNQLSIVVGILLTLTVGMVANRGSLWRVSVGGGLVLACAHLVLSALAVESPRFLWARGRRAEARTVLRHLRGVDDVDAEVATWGVSGGDAEQVADDMIADPESPNGTVKPVSSTELRADGTTVTVFNIFRLAQYRRQWLLVLLLQFGQQLSGINTVFYYSSTVLERMFSSQLSSVLTMLIGVLNVVATASAALFIDRFGRRPLLFTSMAAMVVAVTLLGVGLGLGLNVLAAVALYLVVASFAPGFGPVPFLLGTELFDVRAASAGGAWALGANWVGTFIVAMAFLPVQSLIGEWVFAIFVGSLLVCGGVFYVYVPETKGRTIDEIAATFK